MSWFCLLVTNNTSDEVGLLLTVLAEARDGAFARSHAPRQGRWPTHRRFDAYAAAEGVALGPESDLRPFPNTRYSAGTMNRLTNVDVIRPPRMTIAIGCSISWPGMLPAITSGTSASPAV